MKTKLLVKRIDLGLQLTAAVVPLILAIFFESYEILGLTYFILGGVQLISLVANRIYLDVFLRDSTRRVCEWVVGILLLLFPATLVMGEPFAVYLISLLFIGPLLAVWHMIICYKETRKLYELVDRDQYVKL